MMQRLCAGRATGDFPHFLKGFVKVFGCRVADLDKARFLVPALLLHIFGGGSVAAPDVGFDNQ